MKCKQRGRQCDTVLKIPCYYFENLLLLLSRDVNSPRHCFVNKDGGGVNDLPCKSNSVLLWYIAGGDGM
jgi:hypothetical protein